MYDFNKYKIDESNLNLLLERLLCGKLNFQNPKISNDGLVLYGAGNLGKMAYQYCEQVGIKVNYVVDINAHNLSNNKFWSSIKLFTPDEIDSKSLKSSAIAVCSVSSPYNSIKNSLKCFGWLNIFPFYDITNQYLSVHPLNNGWFVENLTDNDKFQIINVFESLDSDISRAYYLQFLAWRVLREEWIFDEAPINTENRFFIPEVLDYLIPSCKFIDIGAHQGEVLKKFIEQTDGKFCEYHAVEPDPSNLKMLKSVINQYNNQIISKIKIHNLVLADQIGELKFIFDLGYSSQCTDISNQKIMAFTLDSLEINSTLIKIHVEGSELNVLKGSLRHINKFKPVLMITGYHNQDGLWRIFKFLQDSLIEYKISVRLHGFCGTGFVIYAFPF